MLLGLARVRTGDRDGRSLAFGALDAIEGTNERVLRSTLRTFVADACLALDDPAAVALLEQARREAESRGEVWWLAETLRLSALADRRFGDGRQESTLRAEAATLAARQGARLIARRLEPQETT